MHPHEIKLIRQYAINEIAGGIILGQYALKSDNASVRSRLTYHAFDEFKHGWIWTDFLNKKGVDVEGTKGRNDYFDFIAAQEDEINFLAAVHVYELRVPFHLGSHMQIRQIDPELKEVVGKIRTDEGYHISWIREHLVKNMESNRDHVLDAVRKSENLERDTYARYVNHIKQYGDYFFELASIIEKNLPNVSLPSIYFLNVNNNA